MADGKGADRRATTMCEELTANRLGSSPSGAIWEDVSSQKLENAVLELFRSNGVNTENLFIRIEYNKDFRRILIGKDKWNKEKIVPFRAWAIVVAHGGKKKQKLNLPIGLANVIAAADDSGKSQIAILNDERLNACLAVLVRRGNTVKWQRGRNGYWSVRLDCQKILNYVFATDALKEGRKVFFDVTRVTEIVSRKADERSWFKMTIVKGYQKNVYKKLGKDPLKSIRR